MTLALEYTATDTTTTNYSFEGGGGCQVTVYPGTWNYTYNFDRHFTSTEEKPGWTCEPCSISVSGSFSFLEQSTDSHPTVGCGGFGNCWSNSVVTTDESASPVTSNCGWSWNGSGQYINNKDLCGYGWNAGTNNYSIMDPADTPDSHWSLNGSPTLTHMEYDPVDSQDFHPYSGSFTIDLLQGYTDAELRGYILGLMSQTNPYPSTWSGSSSAYSAIDGDHVQGVNWLSELGGGAKLQKTKYRFMLPHSEKGTNYIVKYDIVTTYTSTLVTSAEPRQMRITGTGDTNNPAVSPEDEILPPDWDNSRLEQGGMVTKTIENVRVEIDPGAGGPPGSGPFAGGGTGAGSSYGGGGASTFSGDAGVSTGGGGGGCPSCAGNAISSDQSVFGGMSTGFTMGSGDNNQTVPPLEISGQSPSSNMASPSGLSWSGGASDGEAIRVDGVLRQITTHQAFVDIVTNSNFSYEIRFYLPSDRGAMVGGTYQVSGTPFVVWKIENPNGTNNTNSLQITETRGSDIRVYGTGYNASGNTWTNIYPGGFRQDEITTTTVTNSSNWLGNQMPGYTRTVTITTRKPGGPVDLKVRRVYQRFDWGEALIEETLDPDGDPRTTLYTYSNSKDTLYQQPLTTMTRPDGSWERYQYGGGLLSIIWSGTGNMDLETWNWTLADSIQYDYAPLYSSGDDGSVYPEMPRRTVSFRNGQPMSIHFTALPSPYLRIEADADPSQTSDWNYPQNEFTTNTYFTSGPNEFLPKTTVLPDKTLITYDYKTNSAGTYYTNITASGAPNPSFDAVTSGIAVTEVMDVNRVTLGVTTSDVATGVILARESYTNFDNFGRAGRVTHLDGTYEDTAYGACCGVENITDSDGVLTQFLYDSAHRRIASVRLNITLTNVLDSVGRVLKTIRLGTNGDPVTIAQASYSPSGELLSTTNALYGRTSYTRSTISGTGERTYTMTYPDGGTRTETYYRDGRLEKITGNAVYPSRFEYGYDVPPGFSSYLTCNTETKLNADGSDSSEVIKTFTDFRGRPLITVYADNATSRMFYNNQGQLWKQVDPDGISTLFTYNAKGEREFTIAALTATARDISSYSSLLSSLSSLLSGTDRITRTTNYVAAAASGKPDLRGTDTYVWDDGSATDTLVARQQTSADRRMNWNTRHRDTSTPVTSSNVISYGSGTRTETTYAPDGSYLQNTFVNGRLTSSKRFDSATTQIASSTFTYDQHGRQETATDARNGTTSFQYNNADLIYKVTTPNPGNLGGGPQITTTYYDNNLRATNVVQPDNTSVTSEFYPTGLLKPQYGSRTYPTGYGYDAQGRLTKMTNWSSFATFAGARVTTWNYNAYRGWLDNKRYPDNTGPDYSYTPGGRLTTRLWARLGNDSNRLLTIYSYGTNDGSAHGDLLYVSYPNDPQNTQGLTNSYDRRGRQSSIVKGASTAAFTYNNADQLAIEAYTGGTLGGLSVTNGFDVYLRRTNLAALNGSALFVQNAFNYDQASRLQMVTDNSSSSTNVSATYTYVADSPLVAQIDFKLNPTVKMTTKKSYDFLNRLTSIQTLNSQPSTLNSFTYAYNSANQRTRATTTDASFWSYAYDNLGQVTSGKKYWSDQAPVAGQQFTYAFDDIGNRTATASGGDENGLNLRPATYSANTLNQYTSRTVPGAFDVVGVELATNSVTVNGTTPYRHGEYFRKEIATNNNSGPVWVTVNVSAPNEIPVNGNVFLAKTNETFYYDADGNLTNDGRWVYSWDAENRLAKIRAYNSVGPQISLAFEYDWKGRPVRKQVYANTNWTSAPTNDLEFIYSSWNLIATLNTNHSTLNAFTWGLDLSGSIEGAGGVGGLVATKDATNGWQFAAFDGNGNITTLLKASDGSRTAAYEYSPFGELIRATGSSAKLNPMRFSTKYIDDETDLEYYGHRTYNSAHGRWLSRDPLEEFGGRALLVFSGNSPISVFDALGLADTFSPGPHANGSIPASGPGRNFSTDVRASINDLGYRYGCHTCGAPLPGTKSGNYVPDHQPVSAFIIPGQPQRLYPQCLRCSQKQGGEVAAALRGQAGPGARTAGLIFLLGLAADAMSSSVQASEQRQANNALESCDKQAAKSGVQQGCGCCVIGATTRWSDPATGPTLLQRLMGTKIGQGPSGEALTTTYNSTFYPRSCDEVQDPGVWLDPSSTYQSQKLRY